MTKWGFLSQIPITKSCFQEMPMSILWNKALLVTLSGKCWVRQSGFSTAGLVRTFH